MALSDPALDALVKADRQKAKEAVIAKNQALQEKFKA